MYGNKNLTLMGCGHGMGCVYTRKQKRQKLLSWNPFWRAMPSHLIDSEIENKTLMRGNVLLKHKGKEK